MPPWTIGSVDIMNQHSFLMLGAGSGDVTLDAQGSGELRIKWHTVWQFYKTV
jgi:hypothetical protein